jgi:phosphatidylethanolamine-binding protein (PEBP) family uncharacterized protein
LAYPIDTGWKRKLQMRHRLMTTLATVLVSALAGCGATTSDPAANVQKITVTSPAIHGTSLPALYTCDGKDIPPPLEWGAVPARTGSLVLFVVGVVKTPGSSAYRLSIEWAVAGLDPRLHKLDPVRLPVGAAVGVASDGKRAYSICPKRGTVEQYQFELYGLPRGAAIARQFAGLPILDDLATHNSASPTDAYGALVARYKRV